MLNEEEWMEISFALEQHHAIFYKVWHMGKPIFTKSIDTAAIQFDKTGGFIVFLFNPDFWNSIDFYNKLFVICHESLHVILNHGIRVRDAKSNKVACNQSLDIVVNHLLINKFEFQREKIYNWDSYCWVETVFVDDLVSENETYEFYYNLFKKKYGDGQSGNTSTLDDHSGIDFNPSKVIEQLADNLAEEEKELLGGLLSKHIDDSIFNSAFVNIHLKKRKKWESVIKKWSINTKSTSYKDTEQWCRINRRLTLMSKDIFLPSEIELEEKHKITDRTEVYFFLDSSGSCWSLKDRFFNAALSLNPKKFDIKLFCFDVNIYETTIESKKVYGGKETSFSIIEEYIQKQCKNYPDAVFVITDGYGDPISPQFPKNWFWFLTKNSTKNYIPKDCNIFDLEKFE